MTESNDERRVYGVSRIRYEALVEVGGAFGPSFEAQALDLSEGGMHLRTQYLPEIGQQLTCRFDLAAGTSVLASGEVAWLDEPNGEFGLRFTEIDADGMDALREICGPIAIPVDSEGDEAQAHGAAASVPTFADGTRVRLHIEGLGSPMRARVRSSNEGEIIACSDLAFLQLGRPVELEHAEQGGRRFASIAKVDVETSEDGMIPQLVVKLRYAGASDVAGNEEIAGAAASSAKIPMKSQPSLGASASGHGPSRASAEPLGKEKAAIASASNEAATKLHAAAGAVGATIAKAGPAIVSGFLRARSAVSRLRGRDGSDADAGQAPMRVTSPAPGGGLHTSGRKVVRGDGTHLADEDWNDGPGGRFSTSSSAIAALAPHKTKLMAGGVLGLAGVLLLVALHKPAAQAPLAAIDANAAASASATTTGQAAVAGSTGVAADPNAPGAAPATPAPAAPAPATAFAQPGTMSDDYGSDTTGDSTEPAHPKPHSVAPFGNGPVAHGNVLRIKMDGPIEKIEGAATPSGFTVVVPGRKSVDAAGPLAQRDERIASIKMTNEADSAELNVAFRDGVPNYQVRAHGSTLEVALAPLGSLAEAKHGTKSRQHNGPTHHAGKKHHRD